MQKRDWGPCRDRLHMSQQCTLTPKASKRIPGPIGRDLPAGHGKWAYTSSLRCESRCVWNAGSGSGLVHEEDVDVLEEVQCRATAMTVGLVHRAWEEMLRAETIHPGEEKVWQDINCCVWISEGGLKRAETSPVLPSERQGSVMTHWKPENVIWNLKATPSFPSLLSFPPFLLFFLSFLPVRQIENLDWLEFSSLHIVTIQLNTALGNLL